jgi:hypothetical protein
MSLEERQAELVDTHRAIQGEGLSNVLVGGWAVSAFETRFTTDVDMVIPDAELDAYDTLLGGRGYTKEFDEDVANVYEGRIVQYEKAVGDYAVFATLQVGALRCRQTDAEWSYQYLHDHSVVKELAVAEELTARIPEPELLFALKLHSGRLADARDLVIGGSQVEFDRIGRHHQRGNRERLVERIEGVLEELERDGFKDSLKGVFGWSESPEDEIKDLAEFLRNQLAAS